MFVVEVIRRQIRSAIYEGKVLILGWWCFVCGLLAWELGIILPPMMWVLGSITIFPYVLDKRFVWQVAEADTEKLAKWDSWLKKVYPASVVLILLTMFFRYVFDPSLVIGICVFVIGTAATICSLMSIFAFLTHLERQGKFNDLRKWQV